MYSVVKFTASNTVEGVPSSCLLADGKKCYFPTKSSDCRLLIKKCSPPDQDWNLHSVKILKSQLDYSVAVNKTREALETSNLDSDEDVPLPKKLRVKDRISRVPPTTLSSEEDSDENSFRANSPSQYIECIPKDCDPKEAQLNQSSDDDKYSEIRITQIAMQRMLDSILKITVANQKTLEILVANIKHVADTFDASTILEEQYKNMPILPIDSEEEFKALEIYLEEEENMKAFVNCLKNCGGSSAEIFTREVMHKILTNKAGSCFNMEGRVSTFSKDAHAKIAFSSTKCYNAILAAMKINPGTRACDPLDVRSKIKKWLQQAPFRKGGGGRK